MNVYTKIAAIFIAFLFVSNAQAFGDKSEPGEKTAYAIASVNKHLGDWGDCEKTGFLERSQDLNTNEAGRVTRKDKARSRTGFNLRTRERKRCAYIGDQNVTGTRGTGRFSQPPPIRSSNRGYRGSNNRHNDVGNNWAKNSTWDRNDRVITRSDGVRYSARAGAIVIPNRN